MEGRYIYMLKKEKVKSSSKDYEKIINLQDDKINVLLMGISGCGKSTLINAILGEEVAEIGNGEGVTERMQAYSNDSVPFRLIDTVGYEYGFFKQQKIKSEIAKWTKDSVKEKNVNKLIHAIWFCIDATGKRIDKQVLDYIKSVSTTWKDVPIIVVFTKAYSDIEENENKEMLERVMGKYKDKDKLNIKDTCFVVAKNYAIREDNVVLEKGLKELVDKTNRIVPEAKKVAENAIKELDLKMKNTSAYTLIAFSTAGAITVGAVPLNVADAIVLVPLQSFMLNNIAKIYKIKQSDQTNKIVDLIIKAGATTIAGKQLVKLIAGLNVVGAIVNGAVAGAVTFVAGSVCNTVFSKVYSGELDINKTDWSEMITKLFEENLPQIISITKKYVEDKNVNEFIENLLKTFGIKKDSKEK